MSKISVILDNGHGSNTAGKCSPDKSIREYEYVRRVTKRIAEELTKLGIDNDILVPETTDVPLSIRANRANSIYRNLKKEGKKCILISVHLNAAGGDGKWHEARGFVDMVYTKCSNASLVLGKCLYEAAEKENLKGNRWVPENKTWPKNLYILHYTDMPAVLTENLFQDNKQDVEFLLTDKGLETIVRLHINGIQEYIKKA